MSNNKQRNKNMISHPQKLLQGPKTFSMKKIIMTLMLFSPTLSFATGKETEIFHTAKERFLALTGDTALVFCVVGGLEREHQNTNNLPCL